MTERAHQREAVVTPQLIGIAPTDPLVAICQNANGKWLALYDTHASNRVTYVADTLRYYLAVVNAGGQAPTDITKIPDARGNTQCYPSLRSAFNAFWHEQVRRERIGI
jgi:hypothetical protein